MHDSSVRQEASASGCGRSPALLREERAVGEGAGLAEGGEGFEEVFDAVGRERL